MKSIIRYGIVLNAILSPIFLSAQLVPANLTLPLVPGERAIRFTIPAGNGAEAWVFYGTSAAELENLNAASFLSAQGKHFGRAVTVQNVDELDCSFVLPHRFHPLTPNADLHASLQGQPGLVTAGYPVPQVVSGIPLPGVSAGVKIDFNPLVVEHGKCVFFRIARRTGTGSNRTIEFSATMNFRMPDSFNIGIAGDSYAAGEGAPDEAFELNGTNNGLWISCKCHRSGKSGMLKGVKKFIARNPDVAVDYSFQACSGAETSEFFLNQQLTPLHAEGTALYTNDCGGVNNPVQFQSIRNELITNRRHEAVHMLLMSGGGNNTGFGDIVIQYLIAPLNLAALNAAGQMLHIDVLGEFKKQLDELPADYADLDQGINQFFHERRPIIGITTYPDPTRGPNGRCGRTGPVSPSYLCASYENDYLLSPREEYELIYDDFLVPLNRMVKSTRSLGWNVIEVESGGHGLCNCPEPYFNTLGVSYATQGDIYGIVHPNAEGYREIYRDKVFSFVQSKYDEYRAAYSLGILLGLVNPTSSCTPVKTVLESSFARLRQISPVIVTLKGFEGLAAETKNSSTLVQASAISTQPVLNSSYQPAFHNLPLKSTVIKTALPVRPLQLKKPAGPAISKLRNDLRVFANSKEFSTRLAEIRKNLNAPPKPVDPLDQLFNQ